MKKVILLVLNILLFNAATQAQNFFLETSMPKNAGINAGGRFTIYNDINEYIAVGVTGRLFRHSLLENGESGPVVNVIETSVGGGLKFNFVQNNSYQVYMVPTMEISGFREDVGLNLANYLGFSKEIVWPFVFNVEIGARYRTLRYSNPAAVNNRLNLFFGAGFGIALLESYRGPGPILLNKSKPQRRRIRY